MLKYKQKLSHLNKQAVIQHKETNGIILVIDNYNELEKMHFTELVLEALKVSKSSKIKN